MSFNRAISLPRRERQISARDYTAIASEVLSIEPNEAKRIIDLARLESALFAPFAGFSDRAFYPDPYERAAVLCSRLIRNHPLPDGNKRAAWLSMRMYLSLNGLPFSVPSPSTVEHVIGSLAARDITEAELVAWVRCRALLEHS